MTIKFDPRGLIAPALVSRGRLRSWVWRMSTSSSTQRSRSTGRPNISR